MSATPRTDKAEHYGSTSDNCCLVHEDDMKELELENIKLLEVARAAKHISSNAVDDSSPFRTTKHLMDALKSLEESGVKI